MKYEMICGIETHIELSTKTKIFCGCTTEFGGMPNTHCCPICTGQPGTLPVLNRSVVEYAVRAGLAVNCKINYHSHMDRKNYVYPDLPKAYQISQFDEPVCYDGYVKLDSGKKIRIERIHIEEDAGKLIHEGGYTYVDYNRGGVPLIEIVSMPDIANAEEAKEYAEKLQLIMRTIGVSDCKMQEGSMRCDVNISLHRYNEPWGTKTEIKNINSISNIERAMELEIERQEEILDKGEKIKQSTIRYDSNKDYVYVIRTKENADDYRYFPEPDILGFYISPEKVEELGANLPELPDVRLERYIEKLSIPEKKARLIYKYKNVSDFFDEAISQGASVTNSLNMILGMIYSTLQTEEDKEKFDIKIDSKQFSELIIMLDQKKLNHNRVKEILSCMLSEGKSVNDYISEEDLEVLSDEELRKICQDAVDKNPKAKQDVLDGKEKAINVMFGYVMKITKGKADIVAARQFIISYLNE